MNEYSSDPERTEDFSPKKKTVYKMNVENEINLELESMRLGG